MQMFRGFSARLMEKAHRLGIDGLTLPPFQKMMV
jgi:hypothetical protein